MLILLPPSEGKLEPKSGPRLDLSTLAWPEMTPGRRSVLDALVGLCRSSTGAARAALGVTENQSSLVALNAKLHRSPTAPAIDVYSGVLYDALDFQALPAAVRARGLKRIAIASALWGLLRLDDRIPAYRFSADSRVPGLAPLTRIWTPLVGAAISAEQDLIVDMRSGAYEKLAPVPTSCAQRAVNLRILQEQGGRFVVVSHHNKATKGRVAAGLLRTTKAPTTVEGLEAALRLLGYRVMESAPTRAGIRVLDLVVEQL
ncbi:MAG: YaaA family protein [Actinomycetales bacterium]